MKILWGEHALVHTVVSDTKSYFFDEYVFETCIIQSLNCPDFEIRLSGRCFVVEKSFNYDVGICRQKPTNRCRVIYTRQKSSMFIITAYPIQ